MVKKPIVGSDQNITIPQPIHTLRNMERGPTGYHDLFIHFDAKVELLYCHRIVNDLDFSANLTLCGRTYTMDSDIDRDEDAGIDGSEEYELKSGEHLRIISGTVKVRVNSTGHRIYLKNKDFIINYEKFYSNPT